MSTTLSTGGKSKLRTYAVYFMDSKPSKTKTLQLELT